MQQHTNTAILPSERLRYKSCTQDAMTAGQQWPASIWSSKKLLTANEHYTEQPNTFKLAKILAET